MPSYVRAETTTVTAMKNHRNILKVENKLEPDYHWSSATNLVIPDLIRNLIRTSCFYKIPDQVRNDGITEIEQNWGSMVIRNWNEIISRHIELKGVRVKIKSLDLTSLCPLTHYTILPLSINAASRNDLLGKCGLVRNNLERKFHTCPKDRFFAILTNLHTQSNNFWIRRSRKLNQADLTAFWVASSHETSLAPTISIIL